MKPIGNMGVCGSLPVFSLTMDRFLLVAFICAIFRPISCCDVVKLTFPSGFRFGSATASYQIEGAWNVSDKGVSVWDWWTHEHPELIQNGSNGDVACDSYHNYKEDVQLMKAVGLDFYRFSISWTRVLPTGFANVISEDGIQYYKNLTAELLANGIEPVVTLYHWDHPQILEEMGGWMNELMVDWFVAYARVIFQELGGSVKKWLTVNEAETFCLEGYENTRKAPGKVISWVGRYLCVHNVLKAHGKTFRMYDEEFRASQGGVVGIAHGLQSHLPLDPSDTESGEIAFQFFTGWLGHPIYLGDYPDLMKTRIAMISELQGYPRSRLPVFSDEWVSIINGSYDFYGLNYYTSKLVYPDPDVELGIYNNDRGLLETFDESWPVAASSWLHVHPEGFGYQLRRIRDEYNSPEIWITENGYSDYGESDDYDRISYFYGYLREMLIALKRDGCNIQSYAIWSLMDNFEWQDGYTEKFGLHAVDFDDPGRTRSTKLSTAWWAKVISTRKLQAVPTNTNVLSKIPWQR